MKLSKISSAVLVSSLMAASVAQAAVEVSGDVALTSNYLFRGVSQTENGMAVQGGLTATHESGAYASVWASSIGFGGGPGGDEGSGMEGNLVFGYASSVGDVEYDIGYLRYFYPGADKKGGAPRLSFNEVYGSLSYAGATVGLAYSEDYFGESGDYLYTFVGYEAELLENLTGSVQVGYNKFFKTADAAAFGLVNNDKSYVDYTVGLSYAYSGLDFGLAYVGVDGNGKDAFNGDVNKVVFSVAKSF